MNLVVLHRVSFGHVQLTVWCNYEGLLGEFWRIIVLTPYSILCKRKCCHLYGMFTLNAHKCNGDFQTAGRLLGRGYRRNSLLYLIKVLTRSILCVDGILGVCRSLILDDTAARRPILSSDSEHISMCDRADAPEDLRTSIFPAQAVVDIGLRPA